MIDATAQCLLEACARRGVDFARTLMLGRQELAGGAYSEPFFRRLGATSVDSLDASDFEGATIIADLNQPLPQDLRRRFSAVFDGGTLEHVFDIATAMRSCLDLVELGGHYIASSPANNWPGHAFYQFSPELVYRTLSPQTGYRMRAAFMVELRRNERWYAIPDPDSVGARVHWTNRFRTQLLVVAQRVELLELSQFVPQQSDYARRWLAHEQPAGRDPEYGPKGRVKRLLWRATPDVGRRAYETAKRWRMGPLDPAVFRRVEVAALPEHIA
jgi:hypothetical protein